MTNTSQPSADQDIAIPRNELPGLAGKDLGVSDWFVLDQERIDQFADITGDHQFIHVDPAKAKATPFGGTIAHGFLVLSMLGGVAGSILPKVEGVALALNYGFNRIRFTTPVPSGSKLRTRFKLTDVEDKGPRGVQLTIELVFEMEGSDKPVLIADWLNLFVFGDDQKGA